MLASLYRVAMDFSADFWSSCDQKSGTDARPAPLFEASGRAPAEAMGPRQDRPEVAGGRGELAEPACLAIGRRLDPLDVGAREVGPLERTDRVDDHVDHSRPPFQAAVDEHERLGSHGQPGPLG